MKNKRKQMMKGLKYKILDFIFNPESFTLNSSEERESDSVIKADANNCFQ